MSAAVDIADLAAEQWGLVTTAQARSVGVSAQTMARFAGSGALERITHGVYRVSGAPPAPLDGLRAAWLALDPTRRAGERLRERAPAVVSHRSAAGIHQLGDLEADEFEFTSSVRKQTRRPDIRLHRGHVGAGEWTIVEGLPVTTPVRTIGDLAAARIDGGHLASAVRDALTRQQVDDRELAAVLRDHAHHYGAPLGDGKALLARSLQDSGISEPIERAVALATPSASSQTITSRQLVEQLAAIQRAIEPTLRISEQIANSQGVMAAVEAAEQIHAIVNSPGMRAVSEAAERMQKMVNSPAIKIVTEMKERMQSSMGFQEMTRQQAALADSPTMKAIAEIARSPLVQQHPKPAAEAAEADEFARPQHVVERFDADETALAGSDAALGETEDR